MTAPGISVLTLVKNRHEHLLELIAGLSRCDPLPDELIIVRMDDAPAPLPRSIFPIRTLERADDGLPLAAARNQAAAAAAHPLLLFLDVDCIPMRELPGVMAGHLAHRDAVICAEVHYLPSGPFDRTRDEAGMMHLATPHPARRFPPQGLAPAPQPGLFWSLAFGIRAARFSALGGFDERFTGYGGEDTDFAFRASRAGGDILFAGGPGAFHQHHAVYDPPLQHFHDILRNASLFHELWGVWPMQGWLDRFAAQGLIERTPAELILRRGPTAAEIDLARQPGHVRF